MARNAEIVRQWRLLRELEGSRGVTIRQMADLTGVTTRTIRRDLDALQEAGFALYDEAVESEKRWKLRTRPFRTLADSGFTLGEVSALYLSRTLMECLSGTPFAEDLAQAFGKLERSLGSRVRAFLDRLPAVIQAKAGPAPKRAQAHERQTIAKLLDAVLNQRKVAMRYHSLSSGQEKMYRVDPYRLIYAHGGLYLFAYVARYAQVRTFAVDRIRRLSLLDDSFEVRDDLDEAAFSHSLGIHQGDPERVEIEFAADVAPYVEERIWHPSQAIERREDGSLLVTLEVCTDAALRSWILGYGAAARVRAPGHLADTIAETLSRARARY